ncbi:MAG: ATP-dependent DNA ligase [Methanosarcinaceae archaeon]|nr:ATP-dependent DNA ligase [Methanosarcinaceae archaeon]
MTLFSVFVDTCNKIEETSSSLEITDIVADFFEIIDDDEIDVSCYMMIGDLFPAWREKELGLGPSILYEAISKTSGCSVNSIKDAIREIGDIGNAAFEILNKQKKMQSTFSFFTEDETKADKLTIRDVYSKMTDIANVSGKDARLKKIRILESLFSKATPGEVKYIVRIALQEMRIGVGEAIIRDAISKSFDIDPADVDNAYMVVNDLGEIARVAKTGGEEAVKKEDIEIGRPIKMMLAQVTPSVENAIAEMKSTAIEWKFDGARIQIHKNGNDVSLYSRKLENITNSMPDVVEAVQNSVSAESVILDGEAVAIDSEGKAGTFQDIMKRFRRKYNIEEAVEAIPIKVNVFDIVYLNGESLINTPYRERRKLLADVVSNCLNLNVDEFLITDSADEVYKIYEEALKSGHEGIMLKNPDSYYSPGKRGKNWLKKKPLMDTLDLVVTGGEWGVGRRANKIGSFNLSCLDRENKLCEISKVGTGLSDELLDELTEKISEKIIKTEGTEIEIKPEIVFEVAFEEIQKSPNTKAGYSLRFPRLVQVRDDKLPEDIDDIDKIEMMYESQRNI